MNIRPENKFDFQEIRQLVQSAFETAQVKTGDEHNFVERLRNGTGYVPELALVAEEGGRLIGHIMLAGALFHPGGESRTVLLLGPLSVTLASRGTGVGAALVQNALNLARARGYEAVFVVGDPAYYGRFGFKSVAEFGVKASLDIDLKYVQALELVPESLADQAGGRIELAT